MQNTAQYLIPAGIRKGLENRVSQQYLSSIIICSHNKNVTVSQDQGPKDDPTLCKAQLSDSASPLQGIFFRAPISIIVSSSTYLNS